MALNRTGVFTHTHPHYFVPSPSIAHPLSGINVAPTVTLNETALGLSAAQIRSPKDVKLEILSRRAALNGNTSL